MSKGPWKKGARSPQAEAMIKTLREKRAQERLATNDKVIAALEKYGPLSVEQILWKTDLSQTSVHNALERLRREGEVRMLNERRRVGKRGVPARLYDLGVEDEKHRPSPPATVIVRRHPFDVALFGEYQGEAA